MNEATQTGAMMAGIGMLGTVIGLIVGYFKDRDKLKYDAEFAALKNQNAGQATQIATQAVQISELVKQHDECQGRAREQESRARAQDARLAVLEAAMSHKIDDSTAPNPR